MSGTTKIVLALIALCVILVGGIGLYANAQRAKQTVSTVAAVAGTKIASKRGEDDTIVILSFKAGTASVQGRARVDGVHPQDYPAGRAIRICYDPADAKNLRIDDGPCR